MTPKIERYMQSTRRWTDDTNSHELLDYLFLDDSGEGKLESLEREMAALRKSLVVVTALLLETGAVDLTRLTEALGNPFGTGHFKVNGEKV